MVRQRIEDLGRIAVLISKLLEEPLFEDRPFRNKEFLDWLSEQPEEKRDDFLHGIPYKIDYMQEQLYQILEIAEGRDILNEAPDERL